MPFDFKKFHEDKNDKNDSKTAQSMHSESFGSSLCTQDAMFVYKSGHS